MSGPWSSNQTYYQQEAADGGYFGPLASARYLQVTTFGRDGRPVPARVRGVVDGDRAYFRARSWSGTAKRLRHADAVQVAPCGALGLCYGPPLEAVARPVPAEEAGRAAAELARKYPAGHRFVTSWFRRARRPKMAHYELVADDSADDQDTYPRGSQGSGACQILRTHVTDHGAASIACLWPTPAQVTRGSG